MKCSKFAVALAALAVIAPLAKADDQADIKTAATAVITAMSHNDEKALAADFVGTGVDEKMATATMGMMVGDEAMHAASVAQFGSAAAKMKAMDPQSMIDQINASTVEVKGDSAQLVGPHGDSRAHKGIQLKRVNGTWKVVALTAQTPSTPLQVKVMAIMASAQKSTADEITAGKYKTLAEAQMALRDKTVAGMKAAGIVPATRPAAVAPATPPPSPTN